MPAVSTFIQTRDPLAQYRKQQDAGRSSFEQLPDSAAPGKYKKKRPSHQRAGGRALTASKRLLSGTKLVKKYGGGRRYLSDLYGMMGDDCGFSNSGSYRRKPDHCKRHANIEASYPLSPGRSIAAHHTH